MLISCHNIQMISVGSMIRCALLIRLVFSQMPRNITQFKWIEDDRFFDCIVGISIDGEPVGMGVFVHHSLIITTASPVHPKRWTKEHGNKPDDSLEVYAINYAWNRRRRLRLDLVTGNQLNRNGSPWVKVGNDGRHTTVFDFFFITLNETAAWHFQMPEYRLPWFPKSQEWSGSIYHNGKIVNNHRLYDPYGWKFAAFGYIDKDHIRESLQLVSTYYYWEAPLEDCDEWIPRPWGHFICFANIDNSLGIQNGAALFNGNRLFGIGAFELNKGNESILVFTDLLPYHHHFRVKYTTTTTTSTSTAAPVTVQPKPVATTRRRKKFKG